MFYLCFMKQFLYYLILFLVSFQYNLNAQYLKLGVLKYGGGGDWYANPTSMPNLIKFLNAELRMNLDPKPAIVEPASQDLFQFPFIHMTGHGNVVFNPNELENLRTWLLSGGFLHIDDNYGMDPFIRRELKRLFPDKNAELLPANHPIFQKPFPFPKGLPKIHEHDNKPPQAWGIFHEGRLTLLYTHETDLGNGWEDAEVHGNSHETRLKALKMGANIIQYVFSGQ
jgi:hypothetical protein